MNAEMPSVKILIVDACCPTDYSSETLKTQGMGGTEATVIRVSSELGRLGNLVVVAQHNRASTEIFNNVSFVGLEQVNWKTTWDAVIVLRSARVLAWVRGAITDETPLYLWLHDMPLSGDAAFDERQIIKNTDSNIVCVSQYHATVIREWLGGSVVNSQDAGRISVVYNPIDESLTPGTSTGYDRNRLVFFSSPSKGLPQVIHRFNQAKLEIPSLKLVIGNPGYVNLPPTEGRGITIVGSLPHTKILEYVATSLCVFYPQTDFKETFGLVAAEANALGVPVLCHPMGALPEILDNAESQMVDCTRGRDNLACIDRLVEWYNGARPKVKGRDEFRITRIGEQWITLLKGLSTDMKLIQAIQVPAFPESFAPRLT